MSLAAVLDPTSVALIGASDDPDKIGGRPLVHLARNGFRGKVFPVNPNRSEVQGLPCFPDIASLPEVPQVAVVVVPGATAVRAVAELAAAGTEVAIVMSSGFSEAGDAGRLMEQEMRDAARAGGMRVIGPNSMGACNFATGTVLTFTTAFIEVPRIPGPIAIASQSGSMAVEPYLLLARHGFGVSQVHATGNDSDVTVGEIGALAAADPNVELLLLYLESVKDVGALLELGRVARERELPVIALKTGRTAGGRAAARSHTGALATEDHVVDAFLEQQGIWRARDIDDLVRATALHLRHWRPRGVRVAILSNSGASCVQSADAAEGGGLELAPLTDDTRQTLADALPSYASTTNPVDLTASLLGNPQYFTGALDALAADPTVDAVHFALPVGGRGYEIPTFASALAVVAETMPVVVSCPMPEHVTELFTAQGLPLFDTETQAIAALDTYLGLRRRLDAARSRDHKPVEHPARGPGRMLDEAESLAFVARAGVPVVEHRLCHTVDEAVAAFRALGSAPVAVKGCSATISHKSELGIVRLGVDSEEAVADAFSVVDELVRTHDPDSAGVLVATMALGRREMLLGARHDETFGPVVVVGDGGIHVEAMPDVRLMLPPFDADDVLAALAQLRIAPILRGVRGEPPMDAPAFAAAAVAVGELIADPTAQLVTLDLNPVMVHTAGAGCVAVDAVVHLAQDHTVTLRSHLGGTVFADHVAGTSPRVLALHGWGRDRRDLLDALDGHSVVAVDLPGFGASPPPPTVWGAGEFAGAMASLLDEIREADERFVVVGHSRGGCIATCLAAARPDLVSGLVLVGAPVLRLAPARPPALSYRLLRAAVAKGLLPDSMLERARERRGSADYRAARGIMRDVLVRVVSESYESQLARVECPAGLCWGADDTDVPPAVAERAAELLPECVVLEIVAGAGHDVQRDAVGTFRGVVDRVIGAATR